MKLTKEVNMEISGTQNISDMISSAIKEHERQNNAANYTVEVRGEIKVLPIINLRTNCVTLNHNNNRLAAQLKDYPNASELMENPTSVETQKILAELLASTDKFSKLKRELEEQGQIDPGLITRDGLLVNGNTRAAALLQLSHIERAKGIKVAVLPPGIGEDDILDLELNLQMVKLTHQDYPYTNELLTMRKYMDRGNSPKELALVMKKPRGVPMINRSMRILDTIEWVRNKSPNKSLAYSTFDTKKTHLEDLDKEMQALINEGDNIGAEELKQERILAILFNINKDQTREIDCGFLSDEIYNKRADNESSSLRAFLDEFKSDEADDADDLSEFMDENERSEIDAIKLLDAFLKSPNSIREDGSLNEDLEGGFSELALEMKDATDSKVRQGRQESRAQEMSSVVRGIRQDITRVKEILPERVSDHLFKKGDFEYELNKAQKELEKLSELFKSCV